MSRDYSIQETFSLPSKGLVYTKDVNPEVTLTSMTTVDEMLRLSPSEYQYRNLAEMLDNCIVNDIGISSYDLCTGDFQFLIYKLRTTTYGSDFPMATQCPYCGHKSTGRISLDDLIIKEYNEEEITKYIQFELPITKTVITQKFQTPRMLDNISAKVKEAKKKQKLTDKEIDPSLAISLASLIAEKDGEPVNPISIVEWVKHLPMKDSNTMIAYQEKLNSCIGVDNRLEIDCEVCKLPYISKIKANAEFFRPALDI